MTAPEDKPYLSGFCSPAHGITRHDYGHEACERFQTLGIVKRCDCPDGHPDHNPDEESPCPT